MHCNRRPHDRAGWSVASVLAIAGMLPSQRTWVVDAENRAGADFVAMQPAFDAASHGDTILVRSSNLRYAGGSVHKGVTVLGDGAWAGGVQLSSELRVHSLPADRRFVMKRVDGWFIANAAALTFTGNSGTIHLEDVAMRFPFPGPVEPNSVSIHDCRYLTWVRGGAMTIDSRSATIVATEVLVGASDRTSGHVWTDVGSRITLANSRVAGRSGVYGTFCQVLQTPGPAMSLTGSVLTVTGEQSAVLGGQLSATWCSTSEATAINATASWLFRARPQRIGSVVGTLTTQDVPWPALSATGAKPGEEFQAVLAGPSEASSAAVLVSLPVPAQPTPFGELGLDLGFYVVLQQSALPPAGSLRIAFRVSTVFPHGLPWAVQGVTLSPNGLGLSNPAVVVLH